MYMGTTASRPTPFTHLMNAFTLFSDEVGMEEKLWSSEAGTSHLMECIRLYSTLLFLSLHSLECTCTYLDHRSVRKLVRYQLLINLFLKQYM